MALKKSNPHIISKWDIIFFTLTILCLIYIILFGHRYSFLYNCLTTICRTIVFFLIFGFQIVYLPINGNRWWHSLFSGIVSLILTALVFIGVFCIQLMYQENQLSKYGKNVTGKVIGFETEYRRRGSTTYAKLEYNFDDEFYNQKIENVNDFYQINDSVKLLISSKDPELIKLF